ncbi:hypothetical protein NP493_74g05044 [Ridgeia piscesae]|uniref:Oxysterol-binding protein n=1 Tax=Ridgeia piscesae TaxID=27915 RepID=A0AAD9P9I8_RIDPI|nr:hypothetical protein NP493_74g05044 [Ridgeia piscesae]
MPVIFNEPLSFLERIAEYMEYTSLVEQAAACDDPVERLELVTAFAVSATASNWDRLGKPFNPLLGETYELEREDLGFKIVCEQVSHHPPVSAFHAQSDVFRFYGSIHPKLKFWGKSIEITPKGTVTLHLLKHEEVYTWQNVNCCVHNIIVGKLWIEHYGSMEIINHKTKHKSIVNFKPCGWFGKDLHIIDGGVYDSSGHKLREFYGKWIEALYSYDIGTWENHQRALHENGTSTVKGSEDSQEKTISCNQHVPGQRLLWVAEPKPDDSSQYYSFTTFAMMLNEVDADLCKKLPPTDARRRPDIRKMEEGDLDGATAEKTRLEEKQRSARKERRRTKEDWKPVWFSWRLHEELGREDWVCSSDYWQRDWDKCPDIF